MIDKREHWVREFIMPRRGQFLRFARNMCGNANDAEDLVQETTFRFLQAIDSGRLPPEERQCEAWLVRTLRNLFIDLCRRRKVQEQGARESRSDEEAVPPQEPAADSIYDAITPEQIGEALDKLSPKLRETLKLLLAGKKYHEIAEILGIPTGTVGKRIHDARVRLHELLKPYTPPPGEH